jgi:hypothetical protein
MMMVMMINSEMWSTSGEEEFFLLVLFNHVRVRGSSAAGLAGEEMASKGSAADPSPISLCLHHQPREKKCGHLGVALEASALPDAASSSAGARCGGVAKKPASLMWVD